MDWIRAFESAGRTGSFTAAAQDLNLTQAAISQRIANLEARIGRPLFVRGPRGITLTVDGETWLPLVRDAFHNLNESYQDIFGIKRRKLTISASASIIELWLTQRLGNWPIENRPEIVFSTRVLPSSPQHLEATIKVEYGNGDWPDDHKTPLFQEALCPVAAPQLIKPDVDWREQSRIAVSGPRAGWQDWAQHSGDPTTPLAQLRFDSFSAALSAALQGAGVLLASLPLCQQHLGGGKLVRLSQSELKTTQTYWLRASKEALSKKEWSNISTYFADFRVP